MVRFKIQVKKDFNQFNITPNGNLSDYNYSTINFTNTNQSKANKFPINYFIQQNKSHTLSNILEELNKEKIRNSIVNSIVNNTSRTGNDYRNKRELSISINEKSKITIRKKFINNVNTTYILSPIKNEIIKCENLRTEKEMMKKIPDLFNLEGLKVEGNKLTGRFNNWVSLSAIPSSIEF